MKITREWSMPSADTFSMLPIADLIARYIAPGMSIIDPFARNGKLGTITNDLNPECDADFNMDARDFLLQLDGEHDLALFDPPYSPRQIKDCYQRIGLKTSQTDTQHASLISQVKHAIAPKIKLGGHVITCGWNSAGMGKCRGFKIVEILIVAHGGSHNDTIVTVDRKMSAQGVLFMEGGAA